MEKIFVKPSREGLVVRYPETPALRLPDVGAWVTVNSYWLRRLRVGDVVEAEPVVFPDESAE